MLRLLVALVLLAPGASAWGLDARPPAAVAQGVPYLLEVCVDAPGPAELRVGNARYAPTDAGCHDVLAPPGNLTLRLRPPGGSAKATLLVAPVLVDAPLADAATNGTVELLDEDGATLLRVPGPWLPRLPGAVAWRDAGGEHALPPADRLVLVEARGPPFSGVVLRNAGDAPLPLAGRTLGGKLLPDATLAPGESACACAAAPPDARWIPWRDAPREGPWVVRAALREEANLSAPKPGPGEAVDASGARRLGLARVRPAPLRAEGNLALYATPDSGETPFLDLVDGARRELLVEGYTLASADVAAALARAADRGVAVRVLLEGAPVGGRPPEEEPLVAALVARGAEVSFLGSEGAFPARFATLHAKTMVADRERALVSTDNWHEGAFPATPGGSGSRGFALLLEDANASRVLAGAILADLAPWPDVHPARVDALPPPADLTPRRAEPGIAFRTSGAWNVTPALSPFDGEDAVLRLVRNATRRVDVAMLFADARFGDAPDPFLDALVDAARRNVTVRLLLDARTDDGRNAAAVARLAALASREGLPLDARLADRNATLHAKMLVADDAFYVGSMNWGNASARRNREVGLVVEAPDAAAWLDARFGKEWDGPALPPREAPGVGAFPLAGLVTLVAISRRRRA